MPSPARLLFFVAVIAVLVAGRPLPHGAAASPKQLSSAEKGKPPFTAAKQPPSVQKGRPPAAPAKDSDKHNGKGLYVFPVSYPLAGAAG
jgi:hypothetical protein